jgi:hypothetical protein
MLPADGRTYNGTPSGSYPILVSSAGTITGDFTTFDFAGASYTTGKFDTPLGWVYLLTPAGGGGGVGAGGP